MNMPKFSEVTGCSKEVYPSRIITVDINSVISQGNQGMEEPSLLEISKMTKASYGKCSLKGLGRLRILVQQMGERCFARLLESFYAQKPCTTWVIILKSIKLIQASRPQEQPPLSCLTQKSREILSTKVMSFGRNARLFCDWRPLSSDLAALRHSKSMTRILGGLDPQSASKTK